MADEEVPLDADFLGDITAGVFEDIQFESVETTEPISQDEPAEDEFSSAPIGDGACIVCGSPTFRPPGLTKTGRRKRVPKYCDLHTTNVRIPEGSPEAGRLESQLSRIQEELADDVRLLATMAGPVLPVTGMYVFEQADPFTIAIIKLAQKNQTALRILHRAAQVAPIYTVAQTLAGTAYAVQVDTKGADPHNTIARRLRVDKAYDDVHGVPATSAEPSEGFRTPPRYSVVQ